MGLFDIFSSKPAEAAAAAKSAGYKAAQEQAFGAIDQGTNQASGYYDKAVVPFNTLFDQGQEGYSTYQDATGVNGADGIARAKSNFTSLPGYTEGINMALDQNDRRAAARGMLGSGNTIADTTKLATDYANQNYKDYVNMLTPNLGVATGAAGGISSTLQNQGNLYANAGNRKATIAYGAQTGMGDANAQAELADYNASKNMWDAIMGGVNAASKFYKPTPTPTPA